MRFSPDQILELSAPLPDASTSSLVQWGAEIVGNALHSSNGYELIATGSIANGTATRGSDYDLKVVIDPVPGNPPQPYLLACKSAVARVIGERRGDATLENKCVTSTTGFDGKSVDIVISYPLSTGTNGVIFWTERGEKIIDRPAEHARALDALDADSDGGLRSTIRLLKCARTTLGISELTSYEIERALMVLPSPSPSVADNISHLAGHIASTPEYKLRSDINGHDGAVYRPTTRSALLRFLQQL